MTKTLLYDGDMQSYILSQLPNRIRDRVRVTIETDPYFLKTVAKFIDTRRPNVTHECVLDHDKFGSRLIACKVPELFIAKLCTLI